MNNIYFIYLLLILSIGIESLGNYELKLSQQFTQLWPSVLTVLAYIVSTYLMSMVVKAIPLGVAYAIWCAMGIIFTALLGIIMLHERLDIPACIGIVLVISGVMVIHLFSKTISS